MAKFPTPRLPEQQEGEYLSCSGETHRGLVRKSNQDRLLIFGPDTALAGDGSRGYLFAVVDGMGAYKGSDRAAEEVAKSLRHFFDPEDPPPPEHLDKLLYAANDEVCRLQAESDEGRLMGAVATALWLTEERGLIAHAGDTRAYGITDGTIRQLTADEEKGGFIFNHVGLSDGFRVSTIPVDPSDWEYLVLCTDGVTKMLSDGDVLRIVEEEAEPNQAVQGLIRAALRKGGVDNTTAIVVQVY